MGGKAHHKSSKEQGALLEALIEGVGDAMKEYGITLQVMEAEATDYIIGILKTVGERGGLAQALVFAAAIAQNCHDTELKVAKAKGSEMQKRAVGALAVIQFGQLAYGAWKKGADARLSGQGLN